MIEPTERATEHIASGLHRGLPGNGIDAKTRGDGRKLRIDIAHLIVTNGSAAPIDQREVLRNADPDTHVSDELVAWARTDGGVLREPPLDLIGYPTNGLAKSGC